MALLTPNHMYIVNGVCVKEKIIPDGTRWKNAAKAAKAGFSANALYKKEQKLNRHTGKPLTVTIHNTNDLPGVADDCEQYTRATYNENMNSVRVHFYVDDLGAWQNLKAGTGMSVDDPVGSAEVSWHAGDGSTADGGNMTSLSIEIIMNETAEHDAKARDHGARLAAWLLWKNGLTVNDLVTHTYWVNKAAGKHFNDVDEQCTNRIAGRKWCPSYIFASTNHSVALSNWKAFKKQVKGYLDTLTGEKWVPPKQVSTKNETPAAIVKGDLVRLAADAVYYNGKAIPSWVKKQKWFVREVKGDRVVIDQNEAKTNAICSPVNIRYLSVENRSNVATKPAAFSPYLVKITTDDLKIYAGAGTDHACTGHITDQGVYTIVAESGGAGASLWGKLKSGVGWISLDYTRKL